MAVGLAVGVAVGLVRVLVPVLCRSEFRRTDKTPSQAFEAASSHVGRAPVPVLVAAFW